MNQLSYERKTQILNAFVEGNSLRSINRLNDGEKNIKIARISCDIGLFVIKNPVRG